MTASPSVVHRLPSLTGLRFAAAFFVLLGHVNVWTPFLPTAMVSVSFFFVLSGFVLMWSARPRDTTRTFWRRRAWKILPNHVVTWAAMYVVFVITGISAVPGGPPPGDRWTSSPVISLLLLHPWAPLPEFLYSVNPVSWSLSSEILFYLLFPFIIPLVRRIPARLLTAAALAMVVLVFTVPIVAGTLDGPALQPDVVEMPLVQYWFTYFFPPSRLPEFVLGMVLARLVRNGFTPRLGVTIPTVAAVICFNTAFFFLPPLFVFVAASVVPVALVVVAAASMDLRGARSMWRTPLMVFLGEISFALYLVHPLVVELFNAWAGSAIRPVIGTIATIVLEIALCLLAAWLLHRTVERPLMRRFGSTPRIPDRATDDSPG